MTAARDHLAALGRLYGPSVAELRADIAAGLRHAADMLANMADQRDAHQLGHQLTGLARMNSRLCELLPADSREPLPADADTPSDVELAALEMDVLTRRCPSCGLPAEYPDCTECGHFFAEGE